MTNKSSHRLLAPLSTAPVGLCGCGRGRVQPVPLLQHAVDEFPHEDEAIRAGAHAQEVTGQADVGERGLLRGPSAVLVYAVAFGVLYV